MGTTTTVLLLASDEKVFHILKELMSGSEYQLQWVQTCAQAMDSLSAGSSDICLLDEPFARSDLKQNLIEANPASCFVLLTGGDEDELQGDEDELQIVDDRVEDVLSKRSLDGPAIHRAIRYALERKRSARQMSRLRSLDPLTQLPTRSIFYSRLERVLSDTNAHQTTGALLVMSIDRFRVVNEMYGYKVGDQLIQSVGERIRSYMSSSCWVARLGGDEFVMIVEGENAAKDAVMMAQKILRSFVQPVEMNDCAPIISCSAGITVFPSDGDTVDELLGNANAALNAAKDRGPGNQQSFTDGLVRRKLEKHALETRLRRALEEDQFLLHYQPQMDLRTNKVIGLEALLRWNEPGQGLNSPATFVPMLEETGLIVPVGEWVLRSACEQQLIWKKMDLGDIRMAVNVSAVQFARRDLFETVVRALDDYPIDPRKLELEITEGFLIDDIEQCRNTLETLKSIGVRIAIDDFGTGYSSLVHLRQFPIDVLKIDRSFIRDVGEDSDATAIVSAMIALAHKLQIEVIAEGVETEAQRQFLCAEGCEVGQGYLFSPPLPAVWQTPSSAAPHVGCNTR